MTTSGPTWMLNFCPTSPRAHPSPPPLPAHAHVRACPGPMGLGTTAQAHPYHHPLKLGVVSRRQGRARNVYFSLSCKQLSAIIL